MILAYVIKTADMMKSLSLTEIYQRLRPDFESVYVIPNIGQFSKSNTYLQLLYQPLSDAATAGAQQPRLTSFSILPPALIWRCLRGERSLLHHHWFECGNFISLLNLVWKIVIGSIYRLCGGKIVWTAHNRRPHHRRYRRSNRIMRHIWARLVNIIHVHCQEAVDIMAAELRISSQKFVILPHPEYPATKMESAIARTRLEERFPICKDLAGRPLFLMFGYIAEYKNIAEVIRLFRSDAPGKGLLIAGSVKPGSQACYAALRALAEGSDNIRIIAEHIETVDLPLFLNSAACLVFNYRDILSSGGVALARSYDKAIMVPRIGCLKTMEGPDIYKFTGMDELGKLLRNSINSGDGEHQ